MLRKAFIALTLALFGFIGAAQAQSKQGVVVQVSDDNVATWNQALNVVRNIQAEYGKDKVDVELVVFGNGIGLLQFDSQLANRVSETMTGGAKVLMCQNTMKARKLTEADMQAGIGYVKAGVIEIIDKQKQGWAVLRP
jgi:intracellular sulfur oxidation DsrE/DsrF family protein